MGINHNVAASYNIVVKSHSCVQGLADSSSCCCARSYLKIASTLDTVVISLASSNVACAVEESILPRSFKQLQVISADSASTDSGSKGHNTKELAMDSQASQASSGEYLILDRERNWLAICFDLQSILEC